MGKENVLANSEMSKRELRELYEDIKYQSNTCSWAFKYLEL